MMLFHVPSNVSSFINCGSKSACDKQEVMGGFAAWYSCPVCAYRSVILCKLKSLSEIGLKWLPTRIPFKNIEYIQNLFWLRLSGRP